MRHARDSRATGRLLAAVSAVSFSSLGLFAKFLYAHGMPVYQALAWRFTLAGLILWILLIAKRAYKRPPADYARAFALGFFGFAPQAGLYFITLQYLPAGLTSLLLYLYPACVVAISALVFRRRPRSEQLAALVLSAAGCVITLWTWGAYPAGAYILGIFVAVTYAIYLAVSEKIARGIDPMFLTGSIMLGSALVFWIITLLRAEVVLPAEWETLVGIAGAAVFGSVIPIVALFASIQRIGAADASLISTLEPLSTVVLSTLILGERLAAHEIVGGAFIVAALIILNMPAAVIRKHKMRMPDTGSPEVKPQV